jgi:hypothetical protein
MAEWKKVIVSGSDAELNTLFTSSHITASGDISASNWWYGNLPITEVQDWIVVYDENTGLFARKLLSDFPGFSQGG